MTENGLYVIYAQTESLRFRAGVHVAIVAGGFDRPQP